MAATTASIAALAPVTGTYLVLVASADSGFDGTGTYQLTVTGITTQTPTPTPTPAGTPTHTPTPTPTATPVGQTPTPTPTVTPIGQTPSPTPKPTPTPTPCPTDACGLPTPAPTPTPTPTATPIGQTPSPTPTATPVGQTPSPTPTATPVGQTPSPTPSPSVVVHLQGAIDCGTIINAQDFILVLKFVAGLNDGTIPGCLKLGANQMFGGFRWGDVNCDGKVNALDALYILAHLVGIDLPPIGAGCVPIGQVITTT